SSRRRHTSSKRDWSSDVCSSDLNFKGRCSGCYDITDQKDSDEYDQQNFWSEFQCCKTDDRPEDCHADCIDTQKEPGSCYGDIKICCKLGKQHCDNIFRHTDGESADHKHCNDNVS